MALIEFAEVINAIEEYAYFVLLAVALYYLWLTFKGGTEGEAHKKAWGIGAEGGKGLWSKTGGKLWGKEAKEKKKVIRKAKREKTALLNEYIDEQKEIGLINDAEKKLTAFDGVVVVGITAASTKKAAVTSSYDDLLNATKDAEKEIGRLKSRTWRQERRAKALIEELEDDKLIDASKLKDIKAKEAQILKLHDDLNKKLDVIMAELEDKGPVGARIELIKKSTASVLNPKAVLGAKKIPFAKLLADIQTALAGIKKELDGAKKDQDASYKLVASFVADFEKLWE